MGTGQAYRIRSKEQAARELGDAFARSLAKGGQELLPIVELIAQGKAMVDEVIDTVGRTSIELLLSLSADTIAGARHQGKAADRGVHRFGRQPGVVPLSDRKLRVQRPRVRTKAVAGEKSREVPLPAYEAMRKNTGVAEKMMSILARGVSTRDYKGALRDMAGTVGVSKSQVSREFIEKAEKAHDELMARSFEGVNVLVIYLDGMAFGAHHVITALGIDDAGKKWVLGIQHGTSENAAAVKALLQGLVDRGIKPGVKRLFIVDGGKALRAGINEVYGSENPVQRCTIHKVRNVTGHLPKDRATYAKLVMGAAFKMEAGKGLGKLKELARDLEHDHPAATASLLEGLDEMFTVSKMGLPSELARSLRSTNIIESPQSLIATFSGRVKNWQDPKMVLRWHAAASLEAEKRMHKVGGAKHLDVLEQALGREVVQTRKVA
jgi:transposase-like protein